jgi:hypothetical protein
MDPCFEPLAVHNAEKHRGIVHTPEYDAKMAELQERYNRWLWSTRPTPTLPGTLPPNWESK